VEPELQKCASINETSAQANKKYIFFKDEETVKSARQNSFYEKRASQDNTIIVLENAR
jgi:hypothetical protein